MDSVDRFITSNHAVCLSDENGVQRFRILFTEGLGADLYPPERFPVLPAVDIARLERVFQLLADLRYEVSSPDRRPDSVFSPDILLQLSIAKWKQFFPSNDEDRWRLDVIDTHADTLRSFDPEVACAFIRLFMMSMHVEDFYPQWQFSFPTDDDKARIRAHVAELINVLMVMFSGFARAGMDSPSLQTHIAEGLWHALNPGKYFRPNDFEWHRRFTALAGNHLSWAHIELPDVRDRLSRLLAALPARS